MRIVIPALGFVAAAPVAAAAGLTVSVEFPRLEVAEYHKPYVAIWVERADGGVVASLAVWYDTRLKEKEGEKWLKDIRQWWRRIGRELTLPADGVSGPTRAPGTQTLAFAAGDGALPELAAGQYALVVEAAREAGGRELVKIPFEWPAAATHNAKGSSEIGAVHVEVEN